MRTSVKIGVAIGAGFFIGERFTIWRANRLISVKRAQVKVETDLRQGYLELIGGVYDNTIGIIAATTHNEDLDPHEKLHAIYEVAFAENKFYGVARNMYVAQSVN